MHSTYLSVNGTSLKLEKRRSPGLTTFAGEFSVGNDTYSVALGFVFADSTFVYTVVKDGQVVYERDGFASKSEAKAELKIALELLAGEDTPAQSDASPTDDPAWCTRTMSEGSETGVIATGLLQETGAIMSVSRVTQDGLVKFLVDWTGSDGRLQVRRFNTEIAAMSYFSRRTATA